MTETSPLPGKAGACERAAARRSGFGAAPRAAEGRRHEQHERQAAESSSTSRRGWSGSRASARVLPDGGRKRPTSDPARRTSPRRTSARRTGRRAANAAASGAADVERPQPPPSSKPPFTCAHESARATDKTRGRVKRTTETPTRARGRGGPGGRWRAAEQRAPERDGADERARSRAHSRPGRSLSLLSHSQPGRGRARPAEVESPKAPGTESRACGERNA